MKTRTLRTLGTAALGVAFAATAAGTASAAPAQAAGAPLSGSLAHQLSPGHTVTGLPAATQATTAVQGTLRSVPRTLTVPGALPLAG